MLQRTKEGGLVSIVQVLRASAIAAMATFAASASTGEPTEKPRLVTPNFQNVDVVVLTDAVSKLTGIEISVDPEVKGSTNLKSMRPLTALQFHQLFVRTVTEKGFEVVEENGKVRVCNRAPAASQPVISDTGMAR